MSEITLSAEGMLLVVVLAIWFGILVRSIVRDRELVIARELLEEAREAQRRAEDILIEQGDGWKL